MFFYIDKTTYYKKHLDHIYLNGDIMFQLLINGYLKNLTIEKAILISKQFCIDFSYEEMKVALPFLKQNHNALLNEKSKIYALTNLANSTNNTIATKCEQLINKLLIILS